MQVDGSNTIWIVGHAPGVGDRVAALSTSGTFQAPTTGYAGTLSGPQGMVLDASGNIWVNNYNTSYISEFIGLAAPVVVPKGTAVLKGKIGARP